MAAEVKVDVVNCRALTGLDNNVPTFLVADLADLKRNHRIVIPLGLQSRNRGIVSTTAQAGHLAKVLILSEARNRFNCTMNRLQRTRPYAARVNNDLGDCCGSQAVTEQ